VLICLQLLQQSGIGAHSFWCVLVHISLHSMGSIPGPGYRAPVCVCVCVCVRVVPV